MFIIFDLDDTLIQTSAVLAPIQLEKALRKMVQLGLNVPFDEGLEILKRLDRSALSSRDALSEFVEIYGGDDLILESGVQEVYMNPSRECTVPSMPGAHEVLSQLVSDHKLALVTVGVEALQREKMKKAGIEASFFSKIIVLYKGGKMASYESLIEEFSLSPETVLVCGDRVKNDLLPAKALGFTAVQCAFGRGANDEEKREEVDYVLFDLKDLLPIVSKLEKLNLME